ncbi:MAG: zinc-ribbon domain-containing protein [Candidatus Hermodarchaeota archaeon]
MSAKKFCPNCGGELVPGARFCRFCGHPVDPNVVPPTRSPISRKAQTTPPPQSSSDRKRFGFQIRPSSSNTTSTPSTPTVVPPSAPPQIQETSVPEEIINILWGRTRSGQINKALKDLVKEVETIEKKHEIGLIGPEEAQEQLTKTTEKMNKLKAERQELVFDQTIRLEQLLAELTAAKERLARLEEMKHSGKIERQGVYDKLKEEYSEAYRKSQSEIRNEGIRSSQWARLLNHEAKTIEDEIESINVRVELGELSETEAEARNEEKSQRLEKCKSCAQVLNGIILEVRSAGVQI